MTGRAGSLARAASRPPAPAHACRRYEERRVSATNLHAWARRRPRRRSGARRRVGARRRRHTRAARCRPRQRTSRQGRRRLARASRSDRGDRRARGARPAQHDVCPAPARGAGRHDRGNAQQRPRLPQRLLVPQRQALRSGAVSGRDAQAGDLRPAGREPRVLQHPSGDGGLRRRRRLQPLRGDRRRWPLRHRRRRGRPPCVLDVAGRGRAVLGTIAGDADLPVSVDWP